MLIDGRRRGGRATESRQRVEFPIFVASPARLCGWLLYNLPGEYGAMTRSRFLSDSEKKDVAKAAMDFLRTQHPGAVIRVVVSDETDDRGVPQYTYTIEPAKPEAR
jgi:hypothetical protein